MRRRSLKLLLLTALATACAGRVEDLDAGAEASDAGQPFDAGPGWDSGAAPMDAGPQPDASAPSFDGGSPADGGTAPTDAGRPADAGSPDDGGVESFQPCPAGVACRIMPLGDSITDGVPIGGGYRVELFRQSGVDGKSITFVGSKSNGPATVDGRPFPQRHEGHSGYTIDDAPAVSRSGISPLVEQALKTYQPNVVLLMIGTNDVNTVWDLTNAPVRLGLLLDRITTTSPNALLVVAKLIPSMDQGGMDANIRTYNEGVGQVVQQRIAAGKHLMLVDMYGAFAQNQNFRTQWLADFLHPNADGYAAMARTWYPAIKQFLPSL
jgi:lysophospholipase L1-like esterase